MGTTPNKLLNLLYGKKLPQIYRDEDEKIGLPLRRYLESLVEGGYKGAIEDIEKVLTLFDPMAIPDSLFPFLCQSFGLEYFPDIEVKYQRKFLYNLGELIKRRGTFSSVHFLIRSLTGLESELSMNGNTLNIILLAYDLGQVATIETSRTVISNYVRTQLPYYITPHITYRVSNQTIPSRSYSLSALSITKRYELNKKEEN